MNQNQSHSILFTPVIPQSIAQSYTTQNLINPVPQPTQVFTTQSFIPQQPQVQTIVPPVQSVVPQVQTFTPQVQTIVPQVQSVVPVQSMVTSIVPTPIAQVPMVTPYIQPLGSRHPFAQSHMGQNANNTFANIGGSPYGRISMIK